MHEWRRQSSAAQPWQCITGPAGAVAGTLQRLKWKAWAAHQWITDQGVRLNLRSDIGPVTLSKLIDAATKRAQWVQVSTTNGLEHLSKGAFLQPIRKVLRRLERANDHNTAGLLRSTVVGGQWPQERLFAEALSDTDLCQLCCEHCGSLTHRHWQCPCTAALRLTSEVQNLARLAIAGKANRDRMTIALCERALLPDPAVYAPSPLATDCISWDLPPGRGVLHGVGSCSRMALALTATTRN